MDHANGLWSGTEYTIRKYYFAFVYIDAESVSWNRPLTLCIMVSAKKKSDSNWFKTECILSKKWCNCVFTQMRYENEHHFMLGCFNNRPYHSDGEARLNGTLKLIKFGKRCVRYSLENMHKEHEHMSVIVLTHNILWAWILIRHSNETPMDRNQFHHFVISATKSIGN